jgi:hypothetical protein
MKSSGSRFEQGNFDRTTAKVNQTSICAWPSWQLYHLPLRVRYNVHHSEKHMKVEDQETFIEEVIGFATEKLKTRRVLDVTVFAVDVHGHKHLLNLDPQSLASGEAKNELADDLREQFRSMDIVRYAFIAESWLTRAAPPPVGPVSSEYLERHLTSYHEDYRKRGLSPQTGGGREEVILLHVCDRMKSQIRCWSITRDPASGFITNLTRMPDDSASSVLAGRFVNLLEGRAH